LTLPITAGALAEEALAVVRAWIQETVPAPWREAAAAGRPIREVRSFSEYEAWYPAFAASGLVAPTWPVAYGGLDLPATVARRIEQELAPYHLGRLNPLGLNLCAPALFAHGTDEQRLRYLPRIVDNSERWCQLFSEPGAGSDLASLATRAERDGDDWVLTGQKVWTTWAHVSDWGVCLARTNPEVPKHRGITYFLVDLHAPGIDVRPLRHITGEIDFNEVFLDGVRVPDAQRVGAEGEGWKVAGATLSGERQMVAGSGSGGVDRIGGSGADAAVTLARRRGRWDDEVLRQRVMGLWSEERIRAWTNARVRAGLRAGRSPGPESSIGKVHQGDLNQRIQMAACDLLGAGGSAWAGDRLPAEVKAMLRSRANTIEGGTTEVNKNILGERVLGLPREPDPYRGAAWKDVPRS
jgi:alkylation response protein AidB-like acyl-CoA dehydrogenase